MCGTAASVTAKFNIDAVPAFNEASLYPLSNEPSASAQPNSRIPYTPPPSRSGLPVALGIQCRRIGAGLGSHRQQELGGAIDAVCAQASRIIGRLQSGAASGAAALVGGRMQGDNADQPPTAAMKRYVDSLARQQGIRPPQGYATSSTACRTFLDQHAAPSNVARAWTNGNQTPLDGGAKPQAQHGDGFPVVPAPANAPSRQLREVTKKTTARKRRVGSSKSKTLRPDAVTGNALPAAVSEDSIALRIPFGNKEVALQLGARYRAGGWYAPPGIDLEAFRRRGWLRHKDE
jgi:DNA topoisomerase III